MKLQKIVAAVALLAAGAANASIVKMDGGEAVGFGDSSVLLVMLDSTGAQTRGLTVDLGFSFNDFGFNSLNDRIITTDLQCIEGLKHLQVTHEAVTVNVERVQKPNLPGSTTAAGEETVTEVAPAKKASA